MRLYALALAVVVVVLTSVDVQALSTTTTATATSATSAPANPYVGRWIVDKVLGVVHFTATTPLLPTTVTIYNYFSTQENRWRAARAAVDLHGNLNVTQVMMYPYRRDGDNMSLNATGGGVWHDSCFSGTFSNATKYPQVRWNNQKCHRPFGAKYLWMEKELSVLQALTNPSVWHQYGTQLLCRQDHPQLFSDAAILKERIEREEGKATTPAGGDATRDLTEELKAEFSMISHNQEIRIHQKGQAGTALSNEEQPATQADRRRSSSGKNNAVADPQPTVAPEHRVHGATNVTKVHVVFTQHFDLGYTDYAYCTLDHYVWYILPGVALTAGEIPDYKYTTHPFILYTFFNCEALLPAMRPPPGMIFSCPSAEVVTLVADTIRARQLVWHAFPFDGFNEMLGHALYDYAFNYGEWLTRKFFPHDYEVNRPTAIQQVDVPGLYQAQVSPILEKGIRGMYVGQNGQATWGGGLDSMPRLFQWDPLPDSPAAKKWGTSNPLLMMVHHLGYGGVTLANAVIDEGTGTALLVMCSNENRPSYTPQNIQTYMSRIRAEFPNANASSVKPSTYDAFIDDVRSKGWPRDDIPRVSVDVGDTWVRNSGGDPIKIREMRELRREFETCLRTGTCPINASDTMNAGYFLITGCEHNWGLALQSGSWEAAVISYEEKRGMVTSARHFLPPPSGVNQSSFSSTPSPQLKDHRAQDVHQSMHHLFPSLGGRIQEGGKDGGATTAEAVPLEYACQWPTAEGGGRAKIEFGNDGSIEHLSFAQPELPPSTSVLNTTLASSSSSSVGGGGKLASVLYVVHDVSHDATWGDPNPNKVILHGVPSLVSIARVPLNESGDGGQYCTFLVAMTVNQSFYDSNSGRAERGRNVKEDRGDGGAGAQIANSTLYLMSRVQIHNPRATLKTDVSSSSSSFSSFLKTGSAPSSSATSLLDLAVSFLNLELSDTNGFYHGHFWSGPMIGNSLNVQFHPKLTQCQMTHVNQGRCTTARVGSDGSLVSSSGRSRWSMRVLDQEYSPYNFHLNGTCQYHIADASIYRTNSDDHHHHQPQVEVSSEDLLLVLFGWNNAQFQSQGNITTKRCVPDTSTGIWYNVWNEWNGNWCVGYPWRQEDGLIRPVTVDFSLKLRY